VFVWVGESAEQLRPVASIARLQPLNACYMRRVNSNEIPRDGSTGDWVLPGVPTPKDIWVILNRELGSMLHGTRIEGREVENEIVKGGPKVIGDFPNEDTDDVGRLVHLRPMLRDLCVVQMLGSKLSLRFPKRADFNIEVRQVFFCPLDSLEGAMERAGHTFLSSEADQPIIDVWGEEE
jgi:hypothetical protein